MARQQVTESEYELMKILWTAEGPLTMGEILKALPQHKWTRTTVATLLSRLVEKGAAAYRKKGKSNLYYPVLEKTDYSMGETKSFLSKLFGGSVKNLVACLYENKELSQQEIEELKALLKSDK